MLNEDRDLVERINQLNNEGIALSSDKERFNEAMRKHEEAFSLALDLSIKTLDEILQTSKTATALFYLMGVNTDYAVFSLVNMAYLVRRSGDFEKAHNILGIAAIYAYEASIPVFSSFSGEARVCEERALVFRYSGENEKALTYILEAISRYRASLHNAVNEILTKEQIQNRLLRCYGIRGAIYSEIADKTEGEDNKAELLKLAVESAQTELDERHKFGEKNKRKLSNAHHTLAYVQIKLLPFVEGNEKENLYNEAYENLEEAFDLAEENNVLIANINYSYVLLELKHNPNDLDAVRRQFDIFLLTAHDLGQADAREFRDVQGLYELAESLGQDYLTKTREVIEAVINSSPLNG